MHSQATRKKQSFPTPLVDKISAPISHAILNKDGIMKFASFDQAFMLRKHSKHCYYETVIVQFLPDEPDSPSIQKSGNFDKSKLKQSKYKKCHAVYNNDRRYYTPAFVLGQDLRDYIDVPHYDLEKFADKLKQAQKRMEEGKKKIQIFMPKPSSTKCQICKCQFEDYHEHIKTENHVKLYKDSKGWEYINQFIQNFKKKTQQQIFSDCQTTPIVKLKHHQRKKKQIVDVAKNIKKNEQVLSKTKMITKKLNVRQDPENNKGTGSGKKGNKIRGENKINRCIARMSGISTTNINASQDVSNK